MTFFCVKFCTCCTTTDISRQVARVAIIPRLNNVMSSCVEQRTHTVFRCSFGQIPRAFRNAFGIHILSLVVSDIVILEKRFSSRHFFFFVKEHKNAFVIAIDDGILTFFKHCSLNHFDAILLIVKNSRVLDTGGE